MKHSIEIVSLEYVGRPSKAQRYYVMRIESYHEDGISIKVLILEWTHGAFASTPMEG